MDEWDWYDPEKVEELRQRREKRGRALIKKLWVAQNKQDESAIKKAYTDLAKYRLQDEELKKEAERFGQYWY